MKVSTSAWCLVLLACALSRAAQALSRADTECVLECAVIGVSRFCDCESFVQALTAPDSVAELQKRGAARLPFRFGKRAGGVAKRQRLPFRYGKRSAGADLSSFRSVFPSAEQYVPISFPSLEEDL